MSRNYPGTDFRLPGLTRDSSLERRLIITIAGAYSTVYNPRLLEHPFYGVWNIILTAIISDLGPHAYIVPQFTLDGLVPIPNLSSSITEPDASERIPDFAIIADDFEYPSPYTNVDILEWEKISTLSRQCLILVEGKRPPTRRPESQETFEWSLGEHLREAHLDLKEQAAKVFEAHVDVKRLMLITFSGVWWDWMIYTCQHNEEEVATTNTLDQPIFISSESEESSGSEYVPIEDETEAEDEERQKQKKKKAKKHTVHQSREALPSSSQPGNPAPVTVANRDSNSDSIDESGSNSMIDQSQLPAANVQGEEDIEPSIAQPRRSSRIRQAPKRYEVPPDRPLPVQWVEEPQPQEPATGYPIQYYRDVEIMEPLHEDVDIAVGVNTGTISSPILLGSSVSNQALYIIHNWLEKEIKKFLGRQENEGEDGDAGENEGEDDAGESEGEDDVEESEAEVEEEWSDVEYE